MDSNGMHLGRTQEIIMDLKKTTTCNNIMTFNAICHIMMQSVRV